MTTFLTAVRGPDATEASQGAEIIFERQNKAGDRFKIAASFNDDGWHQWGEGTHVLGDNVDAVTAWFGGIREVLSMVRDPDDTDEDDAEREA